MTDKKYHIDGILEFCKRFNNEIDGFVEATHFEQNALWSIYALDAADITLIRYSSANERQIRVTWQGSNMGSLCQIGTCEGQPVVLCLGHAKINDRNIVFYYASSIMVNYDHVTNAIFDTRTEIRKHTGKMPRRSDATNFYNVIHST